MQTNYARPLHQKLNAAAKDAADAAQQAQTHDYYWAKEEYMKEAFYNYRYIVNAIVSSTQRDTEQTAAIH